MLRPASRRSILLGPAFLALFGAAIVSACAGRAEEPDQGAVPPSGCSPDAESIRERVFEGSCSGAGCHGSDTAPLGLDFISAPADELIGRSSVTCDGWALVVPGSPESSFLYHKLTSSTPACGAPMPIDTRLAQSDIDCIGEWITGLAGDGCEACGTGACVSLASDASHCGACDNVCPDGVACRDGVCSCPEGTEACDGACVDVMTDTLNCGACGVSCGAGSTCESGACSCPAPLESCNGMCADLQSDPDHCGACDATCETGQVCLLGDCADGCGSLAQCGSSCVDTRSSVLHCGECDEACPGGVPCMDGVCTCPDGGTLCGDRCVDLQSDAENCGACGAACGAGEACSAGACACDAAGSPSFKNDVEPILVGACAGNACHGGARPKEGLLLETGKSYDAIVGVKAKQCNGSRLLVDPGSPSTSYMMHKMLNIDICTGTQMPKAGEFLPKAELDQIAAWICAGALDN